MEIKFKTQILRKLDRDGLSYMVGCTILEQAYLLRQTYFFPFRPPLKHDTLFERAHYSKGERDVFW